MPSQPDPATSAVTAPLVTRRRALGALLAVLVASVLTVLVRTRQLAARHERLATDLVRGARTPEPPDPAAVAALPDPVTRYFEIVLPDDPPAVRSLALTQRGAFRLGGREDPWRPMTARQDVTVSPPGFVWRARIDVAPFVPARVVDAFVDGEGFLRAAVLSTVTVADAPPSPEMNESELQRYLAEAVWLPPALLPGNGVEWEPLDDRSARATLTAGEATATVDFHFADDGTVASVTADRYRQEEGTVGQWVGDFDRYEQRGPFRVPTEARVGWDLADGRLTYWRARIVDFDFR
jgi:hypothetical protein